MVVAVGGTAVVVVVVVAVAGETVVVVLVMVAVDIMVEVVVIVTVVVSELITGSVVVGGVVVPGPSAATIFTSAQLQNSSGNLLPPHSSIPFLCPPPPEPSEGHVVPNGLLYISKYSKKSGGAHELAVPQYHCTTQCSHCISTSN